MRYRGGSLRSTTALGFGGPGTCAASSWIDVGSAADIAIERFAPLAAHAVLVTIDPANPATRSARERLMTAGIADVAVMAGAPQVIAA